MGFGLNKNNTEKNTEKKPVKKVHSRRKTECVVLSNTYLYRRAFSETQLIDALGFDFKKGESYHCLTGGDVDSLSYLKCVLRQQNLDYCLFSTWCMSAEDVLQITEWIENNKIKKLDAYVGEIFPNSYKVEFKMLKDMFEKYKCGRIAVFKNHSKVYAGYGDKFHFIIETSANINTNPRTENGCITIDRAGFEFYKTFFDGIKSFEKDE
jgi:hypothetical protein